MLNFIGSNQHRHSLKCNDYYMYIAYGILSVVYIEDLRMYMCMGDYVRGLTIHGTGKLGNRLQV